MAICSPTIAKVQSDKHFRRPSWRFDPSRGL